jgi:hypothetical protein
MDIHLIRVGGLLHHGTSHLEDHLEYARKLSQAGHDITTETRRARTQEQS